MRRAGACAHDDHTRTIYRRQPHVTMAPHATTARCSSCTPWIAALATAAALAGPLAPPVHAETTPTCKRAQELLAAGYRADAESTYKELLGVKVCATNKIKATQLTPQQLTDQAKRLQDAGFPSDARAIAKQLAAGGQDPIDPALQDPTQRLPRWSNFLATVGPWVRSIAEATVIALLVMAIVGVFSSRARLRLRLGQFTGAGDANPADGLAAELADTLGRMRDGKRRPTMTYQAATEPGFALPDTITSAVPQGAVVGAVLELLDRIVPRYVLTVSGTLHPIHEHRGAGLTLTVHDAHGRTRGHITIWERDFVLKDAGATVKDPVRYERLILPAAVWLGYQRLRFTDRYWRRRPIIYLGATDWRSYALSAIGDLIPDSRDRRRVYELALDRDPGNLVARLNLAALLMRRPGPRARADGHPRGYPGETQDERMQLARDLLTSVMNATAPEGRNTTTEAIHYRAAFLLATCHLDLGKPAAAREVLDEFPIAGVVTGQVTDPIGESLIDNTLYECFAVLDWEVKIATQAAHVNPPDRTWHSAQAQYGLARGWARRACDGRRPHHIDEALLPNVWTAMRCAIERGVTEPGTDFRAEFKTDPTFARLRRYPQFSALLMLPAKADKPDKPDRHAVTIDPGEKLTEILTANGAP